MPARSQPAAPAAPPDYIETTRQFWQPHASRELTREDARDMAHNLLGFFSVLREWSYRERQRIRDGVLLPEVPVARKRGRPRKHAPAEDDQQR